MSSIVMVGCVDFSRAMLLPVVVICVRSVSRGVPARGSSLLLLLLSLLLLLLNNYSFLIIIIVEHPPTRPFLNVAYSLRNNDHFDI